MLEFVLNEILPCSINVITVVYVLSKLLNVKIDLKDYKTYMVIALLITITILNYVFVSGVVRIMVVTISIAFCNYFLFKQNFSRTVSSTILELCICVISETIFALLLILFVSDDGSFLVSTFAGALIADVFISAIFLILINIKPILNLCRKIIKLVEKIKSIYIVFGSLLSILALSLSFVTAFREINLLYVFVINVLLCSIYVFIMIKSLINQNNMIKVQAENKALVDNLSEYEKMLEHQRVSNHENKNQLLVIKNMLSKKDNEALKYIDEIIEDRQEDDVAIFGRAAKIPSGGLQGIIYQKMLVMKEKSIKFSLNVSNSIKKLDFDNMDTKMMYDICRIIGVFLDNAIEETEKLEEREVNISLFEDGEKLNIEISNKVKEIPNLEKMDNAGYTTKTKGHGYGLSLVKEIVSKNENITNLRSITKNIFTQILKVKMDKK